MDTRVVYSELNEASRRARRFFEQQKMFAFAEVPPVESEGQVQLCYIDKTVADQVQDLLRKYLGSTVPALAGWGSPHTQRRDTIEILCVAQGTDRTEVTLCWHRSRRTICLMLVLAIIGILLPLCFACILTWALNLAMMDPEAALFEAETPADLAGVVVEMVSYFLLLFLPLIYVGMNLWLSRRLQRRFWGAIGWHEVMSGELIPDQSSPLGTIARWAIIVGVAVLAFFVGLPHVLVLVLTAELAFQALVQFWHRVPILYWRACIVETVSMKANQFAIRLILSHAFLVILASSLARPVEWMVTTSYGELQYLDRFSGFSVQLGRYDSRPEDMLPATYEHLSDLGLEGRDTSPAGFGTILLRTLDHFRDPAAPPMYSISNLSLFIVLMFTAAGPCYQLPEVWSLLRLPHKWRTRYRNLWRPGHVLTGIRTYRTTRPQRLLFAAYLVVRAILCLSLTTYALWLGSVAMAWLVWGVQVWGWESIVLPYSLLREALQQSGKGWPLLPQAFALLLVGPLLALLIAKGLSWAFVALERLARVALWSPREPDLSRWRLFLTKHELPAYRLVLDPRVTEIHLFHLAWIPVISVPRRIWAWYVDADSTYLTEEEIEILLLHEVGHLNASKHWPLLELSGLLTLVGWNYFYLATDSLRDETFADRFAQHRLQQARKREDSEAVVDSALVVGAVEKYEREWGRFRNWCRRKPWWHRIVESPTRRVTEWFAFVFGGALQGYAHPELEVRRRALEQESSCAAVQ